MEHLPAADTEHDLLPEALLQISRVEPGGYPPAVEVVAIDIRIQEVERYPPHLDLPDCDIDRGVDVWNPDHQMLALWIEHSSDGGRLGIERFVDVQLPSLGIDLLVQVAL